MDTANCVLSSLAEVLSLWLPSLTLPTYRVDSVDARQTGKVSLIGGLFDEPRNTSNRSR